jgi:ribosomal protein S7
MKSSYINKLVNLITQNGEKQKSERVVLQSFKKLQKNSIKQSYELLQTAIKNLVPVYRFQIHTNKKQRKKSRQITKKVCLVLNPSYRLTLAIKYIMRAIKQHKSSKVDDLLPKEILLTCQSNSISLNKKIEDQKQVIPNRKSIKRYYRWKH